MMKRLVVLAALISMAMSCTASAGILVPGWAGLDGTTHEEWSFSTNANPALPDVINNPYGTASADITLGDYSSGWLGDVGLGTRTGMWDLGGANGGIVLNIDNRPQPLDYKEIWVQVVYYKSITDAPSVSVVGAEFISAQTSLIEADPVMGGSSGWYANSSIWRIVPNPSHEVITLSSYVMGSVVDQIVVDTYCTVPEPATIGMLLIGGLAMLRRNRR
jgi:hypothetical protein